MPNTFFRFRQFTVHQDQTAMKVCTDACLFGAWTTESQSGERERRAEKPGAENKNIHRTLDIGTGTGLLSLMVAQKATSVIDAVEVDELACAQASSNFFNSPWRDRLRVHHTPVQEYEPGYRYDLIISNPPFYERDLRSPDEKRNVALHGTRLGFDELLSSVKRLLEKDGIAAFLIPYEREKAFEDALSKFGFFVAKKTLVRQSEKHNFFRVMYEVSKTFRGIVLLEELAIKDARNVYTAEFSRLLADYYL